MVLSLRRHRPAHPQGYFTLVIVLQKTSADKNHVSSAEVKFIFARFSQSSLLCNASCSRQWRIYKFSSAQIRLKRLYSAVFQSAQARPRIRFRDCRSRRI